MWTLYLSPKLSTSEHETCMTCCTHLMHSIKIIVPHIHWLRKEVSKQYHFHFEACCCSPNQWRIYTFYHNTANPTRELATMNFRPINETLYTRSANQIWWPRWCIATCLPCLIHTANALAFVQIPCHCCSWNKVTSMLWFS